MFTLQKPLKIETHSQRTLLLSREHRRKERMVFPLFLRSADGSNAQRPDRRSAKGGQLIALLSGSLKWRVFANAKKVTI